jgi:outer membrane protein OmpA-like peptidoglycan-associated protein
MTSSGYRIQVFGHTDGVGTLVYNQTLSERRAQAAFEYLVSAGLDIEILVMKGFGKTQPVDEGISAAARARNRRVELGHRYGGELQQGSIADRPATGLVLHRTNSGA